MENTNKKFPGQGKTKQQYRDSARFAWYGVLGMIILIFLMTLLGGCTGVYYLTDAEYDDVREEHLTITYFTHPITHASNQVYWGYHKGFYYYYGTPHYYPWYYYYSKCPPSSYNVMTHVYIDGDRNKPTYNPNKPVYPYKPNRNIIVKPNKNKVIIKSNGSKRTNKTTIRRTKRK